ncbi:MULTISPECIES: hypothetical protein [Amycolatopsis]|uniref:Uncharacterized protein n=2 Tax=Amycolatopsis TaxID=1813 RepID=A0A1I3MYT5_9PSEU|nr:hypothetical protein [Amycolatopsis sacchari]SFJ02082.1 hypothetical protein SAMN05421835_102527 [Amycolatopsis sacchari]
MPSPSEQQPTAQPPHAPAGNKIHGDIHGSVAQTGEVHGDITVQTIVQEIKSPDGELFEWQVNEDELAEVAGQFVEPDGYAQAAKILAERSVVVLHNTGTGRNFAGLRLLAGSRRIVRLNSGRRLGGIKEDELHADDGYLWHATGPGAAVLTEFDLTKAAGLARTRHCRLVIIVDQPGDVPHSANAQAVPLKPPDPVQVALARMRHRAPGRFEEARAVFDRVLAGKLTVGDPPHKAAHAADMAITLTTEGGDEAEFARKLDEDVDRAVKDIIHDGWASEEFTMLMAVALLEGKPFDEVAEHAVRLDRLARAAELPQDRTPRPRRVFSKPKDRLLRDIRATTDLRSHSSHPGLREQTVRFERPDWANAVLRRFWQQYHLDHKILLDWMCGSDEPEAAVQALCTIITEVPAHKPLRPVEYLAGHNGLRQRHLAGKTLTRLAGKHNLRGLVEDILDSWIAGTSVNRKYTAALVCGAFFETDRERALERLAEIARTDSARAGDAVIAAVLVSLADNANAPVILRTVQDWLADKKSLRTRDGLRRVALELAMWLLGVWTEDDVPLVDAAELSLRHPEEMRALAWTIAMDRSYGPGYLRRLVSLCDQGTLRGTSAKARADRAEFLRLARLLCPDLRWRSRLETTLLWGLCHPTRRRQMRYLFRAASRVSRVDEGAERPADSG